MKPSINNKSSVIPARRQSKNLINILNTFSIINSGDFLSLYDISGSGESQKRSISNETIDLLSTQKETIKEMGFLLLEFTQDSKIYDLKYLVARANLFIAGTEFNTQYRPIAWRLNPDTLNIEPNSRTEFSESMLWGFFVVLLQDIKNHPGRFKQCPYCEKFFWDDTSRRGDRKYCGTLECHRARNRVKQAKFLGNETELQRKERFSKELSPLLGQALALITPKCSNPKCPQRIKMHARDLERLKRDPTCPDCGSPVILPSLEIFQKPTTKSNARTRIIKSRGKRK